jgi:hypothetical protein
LQEKTYTFQLTIILEEKKLFSRLFRIAKRFQAMLTVRSGAPDLGQVKANLQELFESEIQAGRKKTSWDWQVGNHWERQFINENICSAFYFLIFFMD